jgi:hypothetical protein
MAPPSLGGPHTCRAGWPGVAGVLEHATCEGYDLEIQKQLKGISTCYEIYHVHTIDFPFWFGLGGGPPQWHSVLKQCCDHSCKPKSFQMNMGTHYGGFYFGMCINA